MRAAGNCTIGIIMLDTRFPRFVGDIGHSRTWPFDVIYQVVPGAEARAVVEQTGVQTLQPFIEAGIALQRRGAVGITTSCGFLALSQAEIASHLDVPFVASSLVQVPWVQSLLPANRQVGILTIKSDALLSAHLQAAGIHSPVLIQGTEGGSTFTQSILGDARDMDQSECEQDNVNAAVQFAEQQPELGAIVLECTNMAPYANAIHRATSLPVYSIYTLIRWFQSGLSPASFS